MHRTIWPGVGNVTTSRRANARCIIAVSLVQRSINMRPIKFNVGLPNGDPAATLATARRAEELGYYSVSIDDHFFMRGLMADVRAPHYECFTMLSAVAAVAKSITMLPLVTSRSSPN